MHFTNVVNVQPRCPFKHAEAEAKKLVVVLSIQVCIELKVVKDWGLQPIIERSICLRTFSSSYGAVNLRARLTFYCQKLPIMLNIKVIN